MTVQAIGLPARSNRDLRYFCHPVEPFPAPARRSRRLFLRMPGVESMNDMSFKQLRNAIGRNLPNVSSLSRSFAERRKTDLRASSALANRMTVEALEPRLLLSADTPAVQGTIDAPGETDSYVFQNDRPKKFYFDSLVDSNTLRWELDGPEGEIVPWRLLGASDSRDFNGSPILNLGIGEYRLSIDGIADAAGSYAFRLLDLEDAEAIDPGETISSSNPGKETHLYSFDVTAGQSFFFDQHVLTSGDTTWRLFGPDGEPVSGPANFTDSGEFTLNRTGTYTLAIEGRDSNTAAFNYSFTLARVSHRSEAMTIGTSIFDRIETPGSSVAFSFTLAQDTKLLFDTLVGSPSLNWTLTGPRGTVVNARSFYSSDGSSGNPLLELAAGAYTLTVAAVGDFTGAFGFRLLDRAGAQPISTTAVLDDRIGDGGAIDLSERLAGAPIDYTGLVGAVNRGWHSDGRSDFSVADRAALRPDQLTLETWVKGDGGSYYQGLLTKTTSTNWNDGFGLVRVGNSVRFFINNWAGDFIEAALPDDVWTHVAATYDGASMKLYIGGVLAAERAFTGAIVHSTGPLAIGSAPLGNNIWGGSFDDVRIWGRARTAQEISAGFARPLTGSEAGLLGYWNFDESTGPIAADLSPAGAVATLRAIRATETLAIQLYRECRGRAVLQPHQLHRHRRSGTGLRSGRSSDPRADRAGRYRTAQSAQDRHLSARA